MRPRRRLHPGGQGAGVLRQEAPEEEGQVSVRLVTTARLPHLPLSSCRLLSQSQIVASLVSSVPPSDAASDVFAGILALLRRHVLSRLSLGGRPRTSRGQWGETTPVVGLSGEWEQGCDEVTWGWPLKVSVATAPCC